MKEHITELFDEKGNLIGALLTAELWGELKPALNKLLGVEDTVEEQPEPIHEWDTLKEYWDFPYPHDESVHCEVCGNSTRDFQNDTPRKFRLTAANLGGQLSFRCQECNARVTKKHFKNEVRVQAEADREKDPRLEARY